MTVLRLAFVITELEVGGAEQCLVRLAAGLDRSRFSPVVYSLAPLPPPGRDQLPSALAQAGIEVHTLNATRLWHFPGAVRRLAALLAQQQPAVVQSFLFHANVVGTLAARRARVPSALLGVRVADPSRWRGLLERGVARSASGIVCVSQAVADFCRRQHRFPSGKLVVIPNGIDVAAAAATAPTDLASLGLASDRRAIAFIGRLCPQKDPQWLLEVAGQALPQLPQHDLLVVGDGPLRARLEQQAQSLGIAPRIRFLGQRRDVLAILAASEALVLTSQYEGMPNVVLEAMALSRPVVASRCEGVAELLGDAADEQTAPWRDTPRFVALLQKLCSDRTSAAELGRRNFARAAEHFALPRMIAAYERLYEGLACS